MNNWNFPVTATESDRCQIALQGRDPLAIEQISAYVLEAMAKAAQTRLGNDQMNKAVVTVPAYFNEAQKAATKNAAEIAGLEVLRIMSEPTAAAMAAGIHEQQGEAMVVIFDFGGGTYDISILEISNGSINVEATKGDMHLGGRDLDQVLVDYCLEKFQE